MRSCTLQECNDFGLDHSIRLWKKSTWIVACAWAILHERHHCEAAWQVVWRSQHRIPDRKHGWRKIDQMNPNDLWFRWDSLEQVLNQLLMVWKPQFICIYIYIYILSNYTYVYIHVITLGTGWNMLWIIDAKTFPYNSVGQVIRIDNITQHHGFNQNMAYIAKKRWEKPMRSTPCRHDKRI